MKIHPMIFNTDMVKALLDGGKTAIRRPAKGVTYSERSGFGFKGFSYGIGSNYRETMNNIIKRPAKAGCPANIGDLIYVRETFCMGRIFDYDSGHPASDYLYVEQCKDEKNHPIYKQQCLSDNIELEEVRWTASIHMPRWASRIILKVTDVRIERVQDITKEEAKKEGFNPTLCSKGYWHTEFSRAWDSIYGTWDQNPYVWVIEFEVIHQNIDTYLADTNFKAA